MICPKCKQNDQIKTIDSRPAAYGVRRRKECLLCGYRFTTAEIIVPKNIRVETILKKLNNIESERKNENM